MVFVIFVFVRMLRFRISTHSSLMAADCTVNTNTRLFSNVAEPEPVEPKLFWGTVPAPEPLLVISDPAPQLRSQNVLFNTDFSILSSVWRIPGEIKTNFSSTTEYFS